jgi:anti-sigma regulatory factor (Ser/Thr protein kinase)
MKQIKTNESRMFAKISRYFKEPADALREAIQNAYRAGWPEPQNNAIWVDIVAAGDDKCNVTIRDLGRGIPDFGTMLSPMDSEWADDVEADQDPAGLGVYALLAYTESVTFETVRDGCKRILCVHSKSFLNEDGYRQQLTKHEVVKPSSELTGTLVQLDGFGVSYAEAYRSLELLLGFFIDTKVYINGELFKGITIQQTVAETDDAALVSLKVCNSLEYRTYFSGVGILWHGMRVSVNNEFVDINVSGHSFSVSMDAAVSALWSSQRLGIIPKRERLFTFKLPDRHAIVTNDVSRNTLNDLVSKRYAEYLEKRILELPSEPSSHLLGLIRKLPVPTGLKDELCRKHDVFIVHDYGVEEAVYFQSYNTEPRFVRSVEAKVINRVFVLDGQDEYMQVTDFDLVFADSGEYLKSCTDFAGDDTAQEGVDLYIPIGFRYYGSRPESEYWSKETKAFTRNADGVATPVTSAMGFSYSKVDSFPHKSYMYIEGDYRWLCAVAEHWHDRAATHISEHGSDDDNAEEELCIETNAFKAKAIDKTHLSDLIDQLKDRLGFSRVNLSEIKISLDEEVVRIDGEDKLYPYV